MRGEYCHYLKLNMKYSKALRLSWVMEGERRAERKVDRLGEQLEIWEMTLWERRDTGNSNLECHD